MPAAVISHDTGLNLSTTAILLVDANPMGMRILTQVFSGLGAPAPVRCATADDAMRALRRRAFDLVVVEASLPEMDGFALVSWLRRSKLEPNAYAPVILLTGHSKLSNIRKARDCGANFIIAKPLSARVVLERVLWVSREKRDFVESDKYIGPDRRFRLQPGLESRRREDQCAHEDTRVEAVA